MFPDFLQLIKEFGSQWANVKQVGTAAVGVVSGGAAVYKYLTPKLRTVAETDFVIGDDITNVWLIGNGHYIDVKISRHFTQRPIKTGYYRYRRVCEGTWHKEECSMILQRATGSSEGVELVVGPESTQGGVVSVIEPRNQKAIFVSKGDALAVGLVSVENIEKVKGGYQLRLNAQFTQSCFTLHTPSGTVNAQDIQCFVYADGQALLPVFPEKTLTLNHCNGGLEYLISWIGRV